MNTVYKWIILGTSLAMNACIPPDVQTGEQQPVARISGPEDLLPYEAIGTGKLAFWRESVYYIIDADTRTSWGLSGARDAAISPDGKYVAYQSKGGYKTFDQIYLYDIENDEATKLSNASFRVSNPCWTADSEYVLYEVSGPSLNYELIRHSINEKTLSTIMTYNNGQEITSNISGSPLDKLVFAYRTYKENLGGELTGLYTVDLDGKKLTQITTDSTATAYSPAWSADGEFIAFINATSEAFQNNSGYPNFLQFDIMRVNKDGTNAVTIATFESVGDHEAIMGLDPSLAWSPEGTKLAFSMFEADGVHIYVMNADGSGLTKVTSLPADDGHLSWSR